MDLQKLQTAVAGAVRQLPVLAGLPVFEEDKGNIVGNVQLEIAKTRFCVVVGSARFQDKAPDSSLCFGTVSVVVTVFEDPVVNRSKHNRPTYLQAAQAIAKALKLFDTGDGILVTKSISPPTDLGDGSVACDVTCEVDTTL